MPSSQRVMVRTCNGLEVRDPGYYSDAGDLMDDPSSNLFHTASSRDELTPRWLILREIPPFRLFSTYLLFKFLTTISLSLFSLLCDSLENWNRGLWVRVGSTGIPPPTSPVLVGRLPAWFLGCSRRLCVKDFSFGTIVLRSTRLLMGLSSSLLTLRGNRIRPGWVLIRFRIFFQMKNYIREKF